MIENLTFLTFKPFGEIEPEGFEKAVAKRGYKTTKSVQITRKIPDKLFMPKLSFAFL